MLMAGGLWRGANDGCAFGFSNEKSLMYWASTLSCGAFCCACGCSPPLVAMVMNSTSARCADYVTRVLSGVANIGARHEQGYSGTTRGNFEQGKIRRSIARTWPKPKPQRFPL